MQVGVALAGIMDTRFKHVGGIVIADQDKTASFELKLMDIDAEHLALPVRMLPCMS